MIKVAINTDYLLKDYTEESFPHADILKFGYQEIVLQDQFKNCQFEDFDFINGRYSFNEKKFNARELKEKNQRYEHLVETKIRKKYSLNDELSIHRQKDAKPTEWQNYYKYCEQCKAEAKQEEGM